MKESAEIRFQQLASQIREDTALFSFDEKIIKHPNFREILEMGDVGIKLMLVDLRDRQTLRWFLPISHALSYEPVCPLEQGNYDSCRKAYLAWGESAGYLL